MFPLIWDVLVGSAASIFFCVRAGVAGAFTVGAFETAPRQTIPERMGFLR